ncbi:MAG: zinc ribbon domain-containing protein [Defluviitaleaceae bacterium]|nr:zinc ribbon domain-containing protein [Defluviitaleaceae bacterium]
MENTNRCQSCGMELLEASLYGKNADGTPNQEYCCYCFPAGAFNNPNETLEEMIESCVPFLIEDGTCSDKEAARKLLQEHLPHLKRWQV